MAAADLVVQCDEGKRQDVTPLTTADGHNSESKLTRLGLKLAFVQFRRASAAIHVPDCKSPIPSGADMDRCCPGRGREKGRSLRRGVGQIRKMVVLVCRTYERSPDHFSVCLVVHSIPSFPVLSLSPPPWIRPKEARSSSQSRSRKMTIRPRNQK